MSILGKRVVISTVIYVAIIVLVIIFAIRPLMTRVQTMQSTLQDSIGQYNAAQQKLQQLSALNTQHDQIEQAKTIASHAIPPTFDQDRLLLTIEHAADDAKLTVKNLSTAKDLSTTAAQSAAAKTSGIATLQTTITIKGSYGNISQFLDTIEKLDRIVAINAVSLTKPAAGSGELEASVVINSFAEGNAL